MSATGQLPFTLRNRYDTWRMRSEESRLLRYFRWILASSPVDRDALSTLINHAWPPSLEVLPNGVDFDYFRPAPRERQEPATIVLSGKMSYHANADMVRHFIGNILPIVRARRPDVKVCIAGKDPPLEITGLNRLPGVSVTGAVPDLRPYLQRSTVAAVPLRYGAGIRTKYSRQWPVELLLCARHNLFPPYPPSRKRRFSPLPPQLSAPTA